MDDIVDRLRDWRARPVDSYPPPLAKEAADRIDALAARLAEAERRSYAFGEIMAVIHGDGGHYLAEHGTDKALADAIAKRNEAEREREALRELLREARSAVAEAADEWGCPYLACLERIDAALELQP